MIATARPWKVRFLCCGIAHASVTYETWDMADAARNQFVESVDFLTLLGETHERVGVIEANR